MGVSRGGPQKCGDAGLCPLTIGGEYDPIETRPHRCYHDKYGHSRSSCMGVSQYGAPKKIWGAG